MHQPLADLERIHTYVHEREKIGLKDSIINFFYARHQNVTEKKC